MALSDVMSRRALALLLSVGLAGCGDASAPAAPNRSPADASPGVESAPLAEESGAPAAESAPPVAESGVPGASGGSPAVGGSQAGSVGLPTPAPAIELAQTGPPVVLMPFGLAPLYEGFLKDPALLNALSRRLGTVLPPSGSVTVEAHWDEPTLRGTLQLLVPDRATLSDPVGAQVAAEGVVDLAAIRPLLASLGAYRAELGARFDVRLLAFQTRVVFWDRASGSRCWMDGPANDPDGTSLGACFVCALPRGEESVCRDGDVWPAPVTGSPRARSMLASALRSAR